MSDKEPAVIIKDLYKSFRLPHEQHSGIKELLIAIVRRKRAKGYETQQVLKDISFEINKGEFFGIVGRNGSGKSTLLKLLAGIYAPDKGLVWVDGSLTPFIELGVGFNPELTGRENVFLNGALLGFSRDEMSAMYEDIVDFAEIGKFMDQKLKNYSSGMQVRLAFSIAIRAKSDILLLDEVLAVGDEAFQKKSLAIFEKYKAKGQTIILVTHDMGVVEKYCTRALMLDTGEIAKIGRPGEVAQLYSRVNENEYLEARKAEERIRQKRADQDIVTRIISEKSGRSNRFDSGDTITVEISWKSDEIKNIGLALLRQSGEYIFGTNTLLDRVKLRDKKVRYTVTLNVGQGDYHFTVGAFGQEEKDSIDFLVEQAGFTVVNTVKNWDGLTKLEHTWEV